MAFPDTPVSLLSCIEERRGGLPYQQAWKSFFDLYHAPIRLEVLAAFRRYGWHRVPEESLEEVIADVVISFFKADFSYAPENGKFRNYLRQLCRWRVCHRIEKHSRTPVEQSDSLEAMEELQRELLGATEQENPFETMEDQAYRATLFATLLEDVRNRVSPQTFLMFEMTKIDGKSPEAVAARFKVKRNVVDNAAYRVLSKLRELARQPEYRREYL